MLSLPAIFFTSLLVGYSGAMTPGPLLTYAVGESARRGAIAGPMIATGHALLELLLVFGLVFGLASLLHQQWVISALAGAGGVVIAVMGVLMIKNSPTASTTTPSPNSTANSVSRGLLRPALGGALVSAANPYWALWWVGVSAAYFSQLAAHGFSGYAAFFAGHIMADFTWYGLVGYLAASGKKRVSLRAYRGLIAGSGVFLVILGAMFAYMGVSGLASAGL